MSPPACLLRLQCTSDESKAVYDSVRSIKRSQIQHSVQPQRIPRTESLHQKCAISVAFDGVLVEAIRLVRETEKAMCLWEGYSSISANCETIRRSA